MKNEKKNTRPGNQTRETDGEAQKKRTEKNEYFMHILTTFLHILCT